MELDWQGMLDFVVDSESQHAILKAEHSPLASPELVEHPTQLSFYGSSSDEVIIPQPCTTDGGAFPVYSSMETYQVIPTTAECLESSSSDSLQQQVHTVPHSLAYQPQPIPMTYVPSYMIEHYPVEEEPYVVPQQQIDPLETVPEEPTAAPNVEPTAVTFPIKIQVMGYVDQEQNTTKSPASPKKRGTKRKRKTLKKFTSVWNCEPCGRSFKSQGGLVQHNQQIHSGPKPHGCDICGKRYRDFDTMHQHRERHLMKDKPFKCDECPRQFIRYSDLARHVNLHHRVSRHNCGHCGKAFDRADHLKDHELSHENGTVKKSRVGKLNRTIN